MSETVLTVEVALDEIVEVHGSTGEAAMLLFHGKSECDSFKGTILPGGVDTQKEAKGSARVLSARYILEGIDVAGEKCRIFIENNGEITDPGPDGIIHTKPMIYTDSKALSWMETANLVGTVSPMPGGVLITICQVD
ncbi:MAG: DUF3237 domain-containing protein [Lachnospiraceae bacterium]|nr:DUF3237 domain-containing protein [Lachnospiraceae bacterium]